jgi:peptidoglycan/LPS O-acetylase OafA/YrhL
MGYYRLLLAIFVLLSHTRLFFAGFDQGIAAVIGFYLLSGYVMTLLASKYYAHWRHWPAFAADRLLRILPQYFFYAGLTILLIHTVSIKNDWEAHCTPAMAWLNLAILPRYFSTSPAYYSCALLPQSWTLGVELLFYAILPVLLLFWNRYIALAAAAGSLVIYGKAYLGLINTFWYGYIHLSGTLFIFIAGASFASPGRIWFAYRWGVWAAAVILLVHLFNAPHLYALASSKETLAGLVIFIPALGFIRRFKTTPTEQFAGNLSYGVFLNHFLLFLLFTYAGFTAETAPQRLVLLALSLSTSALSFYLVEYPIMRWRRLWRGRQRGQPQRAAALTAPLQEHA